MTQGVTETVYPVDAATNAGVPVKIEDRTYNVTGLEFIELGHCVGVARGTALKAWRAATKQPQTAHEYMMHRLELNNILFGQYGQSALEFPLFPEVMVEMIYLSVNKREKKPVSRDEIWKWCNNSDLRDSLIQIILMLTAGPERIEVKKPDGEADPTEASPIESSMKN